MLKFISELYLIISTPEPPNAVSAPLEPEATFPTPVIVQ